MRHYLSLVVIVGAALPGLSAQAPQSPEALAQALQQRYQGIRDFRADFVQTHRDVLGSPSQGEGTVEIKKPGRMRWVYTKPQKQEIISDGKTIYFYFPDDREVSTARVPDDDQATTSLLFLAGRGDMTRDFIASHAESSLTGTVAITLTPRESEPDFERLVLVVDPASLQIRALITYDLQGGESTIVFRNLRENAGIADARFAFTPPRGVQVIGTGL